MTPTVRQNELLTFIRAYQEEHETSPNFDEMVVGLGLKSKSRIFHMLNGLEERGLIRRLPNRVRAIEVIQQAPVGERRRILASQLARVAKAQFERVVDDCRDFRPGELEAAILAVLP